jgi:hypothetical protein
MIAICALISDKLFLLFHIMKFTEIIKNELIFIMSLNFMGFFSKNIISENADERAQQRERKKNSRKDLLPLHLGFNYALLRNMSINKK